MCATCGCSDDAAVRGIERGREHGHSHGHEHPHSHERGTRTVLLEQDVLAKNDRLPESKRGWVRRRGSLAITRGRSPGSGKTTLLTRTILDLAGEFPISVIEGDQETLFDAERIKATGAPVVQIN